MIGVLSTDTRFTDSPDAGPDCLCSRCGKPIIWDNGPPIRAWPDDGSFELRYHPACIGAIQA